MKRQLFTNMDATLVADIISKESGKQSNVSRFLYLSNTFSVLFESPEREQRILTENNILNIVTQHRKSEVT